MKLIFSYVNDDEKQKLKHVLQSEMVNHFFNYMKEESADGSVPKDHCFITANDSGKLVVDISANLFIKDYNKMRQNVYAQNSKNDILKINHLPKYEVLLTDFISDVEENLSFIPKMEVED